LYQGCRREEKEEEIGEERRGFMSQRGDRGEGHARRPGRSSSFGGHRGGGVGGAGKGGAGSSGQPPLSSNRR